MISVTFIRHGESTDNLRSVWAGWKDAPLSNHGMNQARALGESMASTKFSAIYASDLKRAHSTAQALHDTQKSPKTPLGTSDLLREQHFGIAEGKPWTLHTEPGVPLAKQLAKGNFPVLYERNEKFPEGETLDDLANRAEKAINEIVMPNVWSAARGGVSGLHIAVVSHGLCISELISALVKKDAGSKGAGNYRGLLNTAWTRVTIAVKDAKEGEKIEFPDDDPPPLVVRVTDINRHEHITSVVRQKGIGSAAYDPKQKDIRAFFGGGVVEAQEHSESNARDESAIDEKEYRLQG